MDEFGETIYGTRGGPVPPAHWGGSTQKGEHIFVHILDWSDDSFLITGLDHIKSIQLYSTDESLDFTTTRFGTVVDLSGTENQIDRILHIRRE